MCSQKCLEMATYLFNAYLTAPSSGSPDHMTCDIWMAYKRGRARILTVLPLMLVPAQESVNSLMQVVRGKMLALDLSTVQCLPHLHVEFGFCSFIMREGALVCKSAMIVVEVVFAGHSPMIRRCRI